MLTKSSGESRRSLLTALDADSRKGARDLAVAARNAAKKAAAIEARSLALIAHEIELRNSGHDMIAGCDEAGRGALAGPLVAAAVVLDIDNPIPGLDDSKKLSRTRREQLFPVIKEAAIAWSVIEVSAAVIDKNGIQASNIAGLARAVRKLTPAPSFVLSDAFHIDAGLPVRPLIKGDSKSASIAAASIIAKVYRDRLMAAYDEQYRGYGFAGNKGYGTEDHFRAIEALGACAIHRRTFYPISELI